MAPLVTCPNCFASLKLRTLPVPGKRLRCPKCKQPFKPELEVQSLQNESDWMGDDGYEEAPARPPRRRSSTAKRKPQKTGLSRGAKAGIFAGMAIGLSILAVVIFSLVHDNKAAKVAVGGPSILSDQIIPQEDYAAFRNHFRTTLRHHGPSPQPGAQVRIPLGATQLAYKSGDLQLAGVLGIPSGNQAVPAVVFLHGGFAFGDGDWEMVRPFLDAGFAVLVPILRGENQQPGTFSLYYDEVNDVMAATEELAKNPRIKSDQIFVAGHSAGGTLAILSSMASPSFKAAASFSGMMDCHSENKAPLLVFDPTDQLELAARSPTTFSGSFKCPARLFYGDQEAWCVKETEFTANDAKARGRDVETVVVSGDHFTSVPEAMNQAIMFFRSKL